MMRRRLSVVEPLPTTSSHLMVQPASRRRYCSCWCCAVVFIFVACLAVWQLYLFIGRVRVEMDRISRQTPQPFHPLLHDLIEVEVLTLLPPYGLKDADKVNPLEEFLNSSSSMKNLFFPNSFFYPPIDPRKRESDDSFYYYPDRQWLDTDGNPIQAHGGGILYDEKSGVYYWYGENKDGPTYHAQGKGTARVDIIGVSCYSSADLWAWKNEGIVLRAVESQTHDLYKKNVLERPKVIYNDKTGKYVMWMHIDDETYDKASVGVAISDSPTGPFEYLYSIRPHGFDSRDMTIFQDDDGVAYLIYSSLRNKELHISPLNEDYLDVTSVMTKALIGQYREAPAVFKHQGIYYMVTSGHSGWTPNEALVHGAYSMLGTWETIRNPCIGANNVYRIATFFSQGTFVLPMPGGIPGAFIFMADRWNPNDLSDSRYVWLPLTVRAAEEWHRVMPMWSKVSIFWHEKWKLPIRGKDEQVVSFLDFAASQMKEF